MKIDLTRLKALLPAKVYWRSLIIGFLTIIIIISANQFLFSIAVDASKYTEYSISRGSITDSISASGKVELVDEQRLRFNLTGTVMGVYFSDGDEVKKGQVIAELDKSQLDGDIKQAEISLQNSQISLNSLLEGNTSAEILRAQNSVDNTIFKIGVAEANLEIAKNDYNVTIQNLDNDLSLAKKDFEEKEKSLENAQKSYENAVLFKSDDDKNAVTNYYSQLKGILADVQSGLIDMQDALVQVDYVLGISDERQNQNDSFEYYIGAKDSITKITAVNQISLLIDNFEYFQDEYNSVSSEDPIIEEDLIQLLELAYDYYDSASIAFENYYKTMEASIPAEYLTQSQINTYKSSALSYAKSAKNQSEQIRNSLDTISSLDTPEKSLLKSEESFVQKETSLSSAETNLEKSKNTLETLEQTISSKKKSANLTLESAENELNNLKNTLIIDQEDLTDILNGADSNDIARARNDVTLKELALERAKDDNSKYEIIAPFDGIARQIDYKVGDNILSDDDKFVYIENPDLLSVEILLDQIDIVKVEEGQIANITFDALPEKTFSGAVSQVNQAPQESSGVVSYLVSIILNKGEEKIFSGMTAEVEVIVSEVKDVLLVPNSAIKSKMDQKTVLLKTLIGDSKSSVIETGATDGKYTEVISGLNEGDTVLEETFSVSNTTGSSSGTPMVPVGGGGGFTPGSADIMRTMR